jgi:hypothetical protein
MLLKLRLPILMSCVLATALPELAQTPLPEPYTFLRKQLAFSPAELLTLESGKILVKLPKTPETREVAAFAITRLDVSGEFFIERVRDIVKFKKSEHVLQIGKFSSPPRLEDLAGLTLDQVDIDAIKTCRVKDCDFKMSAKFMDRFRKEVDWAATDYRDKVTELVREMLLDHAQSYLKLGNTALGKYDDKSYSLALAEELKPLLKPASYMYGYAPEFQKYLEEFPQGRPEKAAIVEDFLYWSKEDFGLKPVTSVTHVTIYKKSHSHASDIIVGSKGIYGSHYFDSSLGLTAFVQSQATDPPHSYLIYVNRSRTDALRGFFGGWKRSMIGGRVRDGAKKSMDAIKRRLETEYDKFVSGLP